MATRPQRARLGRRRYLPISRQQRVAERTFPPLMLVLRRRIAPRPPCPRFGTEDGEYAQRQPEQGVCSPRSKHAPSHLPPRLDSAGPGGDITALALARFVRAKAAALAMAVPGRPCLTPSRKPADSANARANARRSRVAFNYTLALRIARGATGKPGTDPDRGIQWRVGWRSGSALIEQCLARLRPGGRLAIKRRHLRESASAEGDAAE